MVKIMQKVGYLIGSHPIPLLAITSLMTISVLSFFVFHPIIIETDVRRGFANKNGRSIEEFKV
uniref:HCO3_cotransp domain-containing protein n=1 Tax=Ascaris lumbricoides TaxID=6252 RepID=A0A0M3I937_ASCLU